MVPASWAMGVDEIWHGQYNRVPIVTQGLYEDEMEPMNWFLWVPHAFISYSPFLSGAPSTHTHRHTHLRHTP